MDRPISDLTQLLRAMEPELQEGVYVFVQLPRGPREWSVEPLATFREREGASAIIRAEDALYLNLTPLFHAAWITLTVHSDLRAVGLTAAVAAALAERGISCNMVAAACHDHLFVPVDRAGEAMAALRGLGAGKQ
jgi:hypothetical protein